MGKITERLRLIRLKLGGTRVFFVAAYAPVSSSTSWELEKFWDSVRGFLYMVDVKERVILSGIMIR